MIAKTADEWCKKTLIIDDGRREPFRACWKAAQLAMQEFPPNCDLQQLIEKIEKQTQYEIKYVLSWLDCGGNVDSVLFDSYEEALECSGDNKKILPIIVEKSPF